MLALYIWFDRVQVEGSIFTFYLFFNQPKSYITYDNDIMDTESLLIYSSIGHLNIAIEVRWNIPRMRYRDETIWVHICALPLTKFIKIYARNLLALFIYIFFIFIYTCSSYGCKTRGTQIENILHMTLKVNNWWSLVKSSQTTRSKTITHVCVCMCIIFIVQAQYRLKSQLNWCSENHFNFVCHSISTKIWARSSYCHVYLLDTNPFHYSVIGFARLATKWRENRQAKIFRLELELFV